MADDRTIGDDRRAAAIDCRDVIFTEAGLVITVRRSKTDQEDAGRDAASARRVRERSAGHSANLSSTSFRGASSNRLKTSIR
jgi:hypothetical protein